ncbi:MAG: VanW family protein [Syntrophomonadaceae bacterium]
MFQVKFKTFIVYAMLVLLGISIALFLYFYQIFYKSQRFLPGVYISSVNVTGYDVNKAVELLKIESDKMFNTPVTFYCGDYQDNYTLKEITITPDFEQIVSEVWEAERHRSLISKLLNLDGTEEYIYPVGIDYDLEKLQSIGDMWKSQLDSEYENARLEIDPVKGLIVLPSRIGKKVNYESTLATLPDTWEDFGKLAVEIITDEEKPKVNVSDLQNMGEVSSFSTWYNPNEINRSHNVHLAAKALNNTMVGPNQIFSFNQTVGPRVFENGYRDALVIVGDKFEPGLGGGICQVSSTLYNACLLAGLEIIERHNHNLAVAYVPLGQDATVAYGLQDYRFKNNFSTPIYIWTQALNGKLSVKIYSDLKYKQNIKVSHVVDQVIKYKEIIKAKAELEPGTTKVEQNGSPGYIVRTFRTFYNSDGSVLRQEQLSRDNYRPLNRLVYTGPPLEEPQPGEGEEPKENTTTETTPEEPVEPEVVNPIGDSQGQTGGQLD